MGYDATVTHPCPAILTHKQSLIVGRAAQRAEKIKTDKYATLCENLGLKFVPVAFETEGRPGEQWKKEFNRLCDMHPDGGHYAFRQYWNVRFSVALQTGIANAILVRKGELLTNLLRKKSGGVLPDTVDILLDSTYTNIRGFNSSYND